MRALGSPRDFPATAYSARSSAKTRPGAARRWIIDPIDGTKSFIRGVPLWGSLVAVSEGPHVLAGAACFPALDEVHRRRARPGVLVERRALSRFAGRQSRGRHDHNRLTSGLPDHAARGNGGAYSRRARRWHAVGAIALAICIVATGRAEVMADPVLSAWDAAPFLPIITEAGGVFTDWDRHETIRGGSAMATNARLSETVRTILCDAHQTLSGESR